MAIITSVALALLAQGPVEAVPGPQAGYDVGYEELVANDNRAARQAIENCEELAAADPARLINHGIALARMGDYDAARTEFEAGDWVDSRRLARKALAMLDKGEFARYYALSLR
jgi:Flp pilus assembly protein TadD